MADRDCANSLFDASLCHYTLTGKIFPAPCWDLLLELLRTSTIPLSSVGWRGLSELNCHDISVFRIDNSVVLLHLRLRYVRQNCLRAGQMTAYLAVGLRFPFAVPRPN